MGNPVWPSRYRGYRVTMETLCVVRGTAVIGNYLGYLIVTIRPDVHGQLIDNPPGVLPVKSFQTVLLYKDKQLNVCPILSPEQQ